MKLCMKYGKLTWKWLELYFGDMMWLLNVFLVTFLRIQNATVTFVLVIKCPRPDM